MHHLHAGVAGPQNVPTTAVRAEIDLAVGHQRCAPHHRAKRFASVAFSGFRIEQIKLRTVVDHTELAVDHHRRALADHQLGVKPFFFAREIALQRAVERYDRAHRVADDVFLAVARVDGVANDQRRRVQPPPRERIVPNGFAGARLDGPDLPVARAEHQRGLAAQDAHRRRAVVVSNGEMLVPLIQRSSPVALSSAMNRCAGLARKWYFAESPQPTTTALVITMSSNTTGTFVRPP